MRIERVYIGVLLAIAWLTTSCHEAPLRVDNDRVLASVGERALRLGEVRESLPAAISGGDSIAFVSQYIDRWVTRQVKVKEAEKLFSSSAGEIDKMVREYRESLLTHKLDQHYITKSNSAPFNESDILVFYRNNTNLFKLSESIVKGTIIKIPKSYNDIESLERMMKSNDTDSRYNLLSICDRIDGGAVFDLDVNWVTYDDFIAHLPIVRNSNENYMKRNGVQRLSDDSFSYLFEIVAYRSKGYQAPLDRVRGEVERILTTQYNHELIRENDRKIYSTARRTGEIRIHLNDSELKR